MRPQDIERVANSVMGSLGRPTRASAGCGGVSSPDTYGCDTSYSCQVTTYECGGAGVFACTMEGFDCPSMFDCPGPDMFSCDCGYTMPE